jgi:hypothetical protein
MSASAQETVTRPPSRLEDTTRGRPKLIDRINTPSSPRVLRGHDEIRTWIEDVCERDMTHRVDMPVLAERGAGFTETCRYADGTNVLCAAVIELRDGQIARQVGVQAWDE